MAHAAGGQLVAVCDTVGERAQALAEQFDAESYTDIDQMLSRGDIHVVCICLPTRLHLEIGQRVAEAGKHLVVEKPLELNLERTDELLSVARRNDVQVAAIFNRRFIPAVKAAKRAVEEGFLGDILVADMYYKSYRTQEYYDGSGWRGTWDLEGGAALVNQGIHGVDALRWIAGPVSRTFGYSDHLRHNIEADDSTCAVIRYESGALGVVQAMTSVFPALPNRLEFHGTKGTIQLADYQVFRWDVPGAEDWPNQIAVEEQEWLVDGRGLTQIGHYAQIADMVGVARERRSPVVSGEDGRDPLEIVLAIYESARSGSEVHIPLAQPIG
jgi:UDP-N-acetyl-2-amino-2-deoxyglucuronate dehydrogenase